MARTIKIRTAYAYSPKFKSYQARAFVLETDNPGLPSTHSFRHSIATGIGDTAQEAIGDAVKYCRDMMRRDRGVDVETVEHGGRVSALILEALAF